YRNETVFLLPFRIGVRSKLRFAAIRSTNLSEVLGCLKIRRDSARRILLGQVFLGRVSRRSAYVRRQLP
ncbi:MAG: hypothetical protein DME63_09465, partial [Verrucomicrobia bacterium]